MSDSLLEKFAAFYEGLPSSVRHDLAFMLVVLADENMIVVDPDMIEEDRVRTLFSARTRTGQLGNLINAVSMFDVYFAMDAEARFGSCASTGRHRRNDDLISSHYSDRLEALRRSARRWHELRRTVFTPQAIAAALIPPDRSAGRRNRSRYSVTNLVEESGHAIP